MLKVEDKEVYIGDKEVDAILAKFDLIDAMVFTHPDAYKPSHKGRPSPLIQVTFDTTLVVVNMAYQAVFRKSSNINCTISHVWGGRASHCG